MANAQAAMNGDIAEKEGPIDIYTGNPAPVLSGPAASGGNCGGDYRYQWQYSVDGGATYNNVTTGTGGTTTAYTSDVLTQTTYFRRKDQCGTTTDISFSNAVIVNVHQHLTSASVTPAGPLTITYNTSPGTLTTTNPTGGIGSTVTYQWQRSTDSTTYSNVGSPTTLIAGSTTQPTYNPGNLTASVNYYRCQYVCGETTYSNVVRINVNPQVFPGVISPTSIGIGYNTSPGAIMAVSASGGNCGGSFTYQWQQSMDGTNYTNITGATGLNYTPGNLTATTYFRRKVTCGIDNLYTAACQVSVGTTTALYNFIRTRDISKPLVTDEASAAALNTLADVKQTTQYFDGLGRPVQSVGWQANPSKNDLVTPEAYDGYGREVIKYLPYAATTNDGNFKANALGDDNTFNITQYPDEQYYFGKTDYESSPLNIATATYAPGNNWIGVNRGISVYHYSNTAKDTVRLWAVTDVANSFGTYTSTAAYAAGSLYKTITVDENGKQVIEFKDKQDLVILKKVQLTAAADNGTGSGYTGWLSTYYIYDIYKQLRCVVQPVGVDLLAANSWNMAALSGIILKEQCFRYEYDKRNRMIMKQVPGAGEVDMVYDARDRMVMTQDANMRAAGKWQVTLYENDFNRSVETGLVLNSSIGGLTFTSYLTTAASSTAYPFTASTTPATGWELLTVTHYDDYSSLPTGLSSTITAPGSVNLITTYNVSPYYAQPVTASAYTSRGMATWTQVKLLGTTSQFDATVNIYDEKGQVIQNKSINITGGLDITTTQYDFAGKVLRTDVKNQKLGGTAQNYEVATKLTYDDFGRNTKIEKLLNSTGSWKQVATLAYDNLGQLKTKGLGINPLNTANALETLTYDYNIRGWLLGMNRDYAKTVASTTNYFGFDLGYDKTAIKPTSGTSLGSYTQSMYNGNITGMVWKSTGDDQVRKYDFTYDAANRLKTAAYKQYSTANSAFNLTDGIDFSVSNLTYDNNGNIKSQQQNGWKVGGSVSIDNLTYTYIANTNRLQNVVDGSNDVNSVLGDFKYSSTYNTALGGTKTTAATDYSYDVTAI